MRARVSQLLDQDALYPRLQRDFIQGRYVGLLSFDGDDSKPPASDLVGSGRQDLSNPWGGIVFGVS